MLGCGTFGSSETPVGKRCPKEPLAAPESQVPTLALCEYHIVFTHYAIPTVFVYIRLHRIICVTIEFFTKNEKNKLFDAFGVV